MQHLTEEELEILKKRLREVYLEILGDVQVSKSQSQEVGDDGIKDIADMAADSFSRQVIMELGERERERLREVEAAFKRMKDGNYGVCEETAEPIPFSRLKAIPYARYTVAAQNDIERRKRS